MRTFISIPVPDTVKQHADKIKNELQLVAADIKWVEYQNYHLTLKFLGDINRSYIDDILQRLTTVGESCPPFQLSTKQIGYFPNSKRPRVIWMGLEGEVDKAGFLGERVDAYLSQIGFEPEKQRGYHLTLGRIRSDLHQNELLNKAYNINKNMAMIDFTVQEFCFMESQLSSSGPRYIPLGKINLNG
ncbi:MAG: RNA 2',3'-cyclic phosphodiesterase [Syntrophomonadaceae bacterium]|nr:RNA 2',3'-cyclic phosphodiesterase [Syntrophomonadaceae bacterium]MDD3022372.1 RNA 2',3'-cyclic phosphodiesterase [Syntrophomonadaceae bacterium]